VAGTLVVALASALIAGRRRRSAAGRSPGRER
jgi:hypothetical protein